MTNLSTLIEQLQQAGFIFVIQENSLRVRHADKVRKLTDEQKIIIKEHKQDIINYLQRKQVGSIEKSSDGKQLPLSFAQQRLWFLDQYQNGDSSHYNIPIAFKLSGPLHIELLEAAFNQVIIRHESFRTYFKINSVGEPYQEIMSESELQPLKLSAQTIASADLQERLKLASLKPFDLSCGPLIRVELFKIAEQQAEYILFINQHHIISDAWSIGVLFSELSLLYNSLLDNTQFNLAPLKFQYADFAGWQRNYLMGDILQKQLVYWKSQLEGFEQLQLATDRPRPSVRSYHGNTYRFKIDKALEQQLQVLAKQTKGTLYVILLSAFYLLLNRYSNQEDIVVGSPIANRHQQQLEDLIGFFVNTLALRASIKPEHSFKSLIEQVRECCLAAYEHQDLPFEKLVEELGISRDQSHAPLFQVMFTLQNATTQQLNLRGITATNFDIDYQIAKFDLTLGLIETPEGLLGSIEYNTDLYNEATILRMQQHYLSYLQMMVNNPQQRIADIDLLALPEYQTILFDWNKTESAYPQAKLMHQLFEEQVANTPNHIAVIMPDQQLTYQELNDKANQLAHLLLSKGVKPGNYVAILLDRSIAMVVAVLAVLKAGAVYVPLDISFPEARIQGILARLSVQVLLTEKSLVRLLYGLQWALPALQDIVLMDVISQKLPIEKINLHEVSSFWDYVSEKAVDAITAGGFISSYTGEAFSETEVNEYRGHIVQLLQPYLGADKRVLEVGCGSGTIMFDVAHQVASYTGLDPSSLTQQCNQATIVQNNYHNIELVTGYAHDIEAMAPATYDVVLVASTIQFFPGYVYLERFIEDALRLLTPGGRLLICDVLDPTLKAQFQQSIEDFINENPQWSSKAKKSFDAELYVHESFFQKLQQELNDFAHCKIINRRHGFSSELQYRYDIVIEKSLHDSAPQSNKNILSNKKFLTDYHVSIMPKNNIPIAITSDDVAYIIHTSGSTGTPKGVVVNHTAAVNLIDWVNKTFEINAKDKLLFVTSLCFDLSVYDVFGVLAAGGCIRVATQQELRDPDKLSEIIHTESITFWDSAPAALQQLVPAFLQNKGSQPKSSLRLVFLSGDWIPLNLPPKLKEMFPEVTVVSLGGATEATIWSNYYVIKNIEPHWVSVPYGKPIQNANYYLLNEQLKPCPIGVSGDLYIGGQCLALGYINEPELTQQKFIANPFCPGEKIYKTGDMARWLADGNMEFLGRKDSQVKIRGYRIELGEIECALTQHPAVDQCIVIDREYDQVKQLCAYYSLKPNKNATTGELKTHLNRLLPSYMIPAFFMELMCFPVTSNGKLDRKALPAPSINGLLDNNFSLPKSKLEQQLMVIWCQVLGLTTVGIENNFFDVGGDSLRAVKLQMHINQHLNARLKVIDIFTYPTIRSLAEHIAGAGHTIQTSTLPLQQYVADDIAIIACSGAFSGSNNVEDYWESIINGKEGISHLTVEDYIKLGISTERLNQKNYVSAAGMLDDYDQFDAVFWDFSPREAALLDPQIRRFLQHSWVALENSGYITQRDQLSIGVFAGAGSNHYLMHNIQSQSQKDLFESYVLGNKDFLASRVAYHLNLCGPVVNLYTACSTSLLAVTEACEKLLLHRCDLALAGGVTLQYPENFGYVYQEGLIASPDGHCRVFDAAAQGTVSGSGIGVVVLKRLADAKRDNDTILAVIKGYGVNNDGNQKVGYTAPSVLGQRDCILAAQRMAGISSDEVSYVECHGSATALGDPIEIEALKAAFAANGRTSRQSPCILGGVKANVGHTDVAAGIAGLIKVCKMLQERMIPPQIHFKTANPQLQLENSDFTIITEKQSWQCEPGKLRKAGISAFGIGGTNVHLILEEAPTTGNNDALDRAEKPAYLLSLSAKTQTSLTEAKLALADYLVQHPELALKEVAYTLHRQRLAFSERYVTVSHDISEAIVSLRRGGNAYTCKATAPKIVFLCSGVGEQYINMGRELYETETRYRQYIDQACELARPYLGSDLREVLFPTLQKECIPLTQTTLVHTAVFICNYAMAQLLMQWGITPDILIGHSLGEYVAACLAGVFSLEDALYLIIRRAQIIEALPAGGMLAVPLKAQMLLSHLNEELSLAAVNGPFLSVVSGTVTALNNLSQTLRDDAIVSVPLPVTHAFHSKQLVIAREALLKLFASVKFKAPQVPYVSNLTGKAVTPGEVVDPQYWYRHTCETVQFSLGIQEIMQQPNVIFIEIGPGNNLTSAVLQHQTTKVKLNGLVFNTLRNQDQRDREPQSDYDYLLKTLGKLWLHGIKLDWSAFYQDQGIKPVTLPAYAFNKQRYWLAGADNALESTHVTKRRIINEWFYEALWQQSLMPSSSINGLKNYLIFNDNLGLSKDLINQLQQYGHQVYEASLSNYKIIISQLALQHVVLDHVFYTGLLTEPGLGPVTIVSAEHYQKIAFDAILALVQTIANVQLNVKQINFITNDLFTLYDEHSQPEKAVILGLLKCIPQEYAGMRCRLIDIVFDKQFSSRLSQLVIQEINSNETVSEVVYRQGKRWIKNYSMIPAPALPRNQILRPRGTYLITGGLGKVALLLGKYLAKTYQASLILMGRSVPTVEAQAAIQEMKAYGAQVTVIQADASQYVDLQRAIQESIASYGELHGVMHFAGALREQDFIELQAMTPALVQTQFNTKVNGLLHLANLTTELNLDFCMVASSLSPILGGLRLGAYAAANAFMDVFIAYQQKQSTAMQWLAFNMDGWDFENTAESLDIKPDEAFHYFDAYFSQFMQPGQIITATHDLNERIKTWVNFEDKRSDSTQQQLYARPELHIDYVQPETDIEKRLMVLWQEVLGIEQIGANDCFFGLGGNSLTGTYLISKIRREFNTPILIQALFENRTLRELAQVLNSTMTSSTAMARMEID